jgi:glutaredoxin
MSKLKIYTKSHCPYCDSAKRLFSQLNQQYEEINLENDPDLRSKLSSENGGWRTMPMIFAGTEFLGGFTDVKALHDRGEFLPKLS